MATQNANGTTTMQIVSGQQQTESEDRRIAALLDTYFVDQAPTTSTIQPLSTTIAVATNPNAAGVVAAPTNIVAKYIFVFLWKK